MTQAQILEISIPKTTSKKLFPWLCWLCGGLFHGKPDVAHYHPWGRVCFRCYRENVIG